jgi:hypothetical protein
MQVGYQNQSTAFIIGGDNVRINAFGTGTFNGNGDDWYKWIRQQENTSNYPGRPHALTLSRLTNSAIHGLRFLRSQMWYVKALYYDLKVHFRMLIIVLISKDNVDHPLSQLGSR